jgi:chemotaxis protein CheC
VKSWKPIEIDALSEIINLGMGTAAAALSRMTDCEILLSVPSLEFTTRNSVTAKLRQSSETRLVAVREPFDGLIAGDAFLLFPEHRSLEIVRAILKDTTSEETLTEVAREALCEVGNIILNACLATLCNMLKESINTGLPDLAYWSEHADDDLEGMFMRIHFQISSTGADGYMLIFMRADSLDVLQGKIVEFINGLGG